MLGVVVVCLQSQYTGRGGRRISQCHTGLHREVKAGLGCVCENPSLKTKPKTPNKSNNDDRICYQTTIEGFLLTQDWPSTLFSLRSFCVGSFHSTLSESRGCTIMTPGTSLIICCLNQDEAAPRLFYSSSETVLLLNSISALQILADLSRRMRVLCLTFVSSMQCQGRK